MVADLRTRRPSVRNRAPRARSHRGLLGAPRSELALTLDGVFTQGEAGLLGLALDPGFCAEPLRLSLLLGCIGRRCRQPDRTLSRSQPVDWPSVPCCSTGFPAATIHDGGRLSFGPDGLLYATAGDAANTELAQDVASLAGKILRITPRRLVGRRTTDSARRCTPTVIATRKDSTGIPRRGDLWAVGTRAPAATTRST